MYQALYRKYRPQTFDEVVGQEGITRVLKAQLQTGKLSHAYLFTGSRGTGKTSCAKIMAKAVNCLNPQNGNPCNCCEACRSIDSGTCMDVLEIDAASNNGVDQVRALRDDAIYSPATVRYRVYIVDEVHMLSISAFNALLKIIEEPPEHLIFILATTELHKVPATILSRCQRFSFRRISPEDVAQRLKYVADHEGVELEPGAAMVLGRMADGALRDGVSLLDQCASASVGPLTEEGVYQYLGLAGTRSAAQLMQDIGSADTTAALTLYDELYAAGKDVGALLDELCCLARDLLVLKNAPKAGLSMLSGVSSLKEAQTLKDMFSVGELIRIMSVLQDTMAGFTRGGKTRMDGEMCLIRLCRPELSLDPDALNARISKLEEAVASGVQVRPAAPEKPAPVVPKQEAAPPPEEPPAPKQEPQKAEPAGVLPASFWTDLVSQVSPELPPPDRGFLATGPDVTVKAVLKPPFLELYFSTTFFQERIKQPPILEIISRKASAILKQQVIAKVMEKTASAAPGGKYDDLLAFGKAHPDVISIK